MKPSSHGHGSADFHRRMPSEWRLKVAAFQHAWPSAPGTCILSCAEAIEETEPPVGGGGFAGFTSAASPQTESSWRSQTSCAASLAARSCQVCSSETMERWCFSPLRTSSTSPRSMTPPSEPSLAASCVRK